MKHHTPASKRHEDHCTECEVCIVGGQCREARVLLDDADAADWAVVGATSDEYLPPGYTPAAWAYELRTRATVAA